MNYFFSVLLLITGGYLVWRGCFVLRQARRMKRWTETNINIIKAEIDSELDVIKYARLTYFYPVVKYTYSFAGDTFQSDTVALDMKSVWSDTREEAEKLLGEIASRRTAYINPENIRQSVILRYLSKKRISHFWALIASGVLICLTSVALLLLT